MGTSNAVKNLFLLVIIVLQLLLIAAIEVIKYRYRHSDRSDPVDWIDIGYIIMRNLWMPIVFLLLTLMAAIFIRGHKMLRIVAALLAVTGFLIFNKVYLYPF